MAAGRGCWLKSDMTGSGDHDVGLLLNTMPVPLTPAPGQAAGRGTQREPRGRALGARHVAYGARPEHYPVVGEVLIASMAEVAGAAWQPEHERAWTAAFAVVAGVMCDGAA